jgi:hypothetical protein
VDVIRGAIDAHLHPQAVSAPAPQPWTHRLPGLLAAGAGLSFSAAIVLIAFRSGPDWGDAASLPGIALVLMLVSLPGDYMADHGRRIAIALAVFAGCVVGASAQGWGVPAAVLGIGAELIGICGLLALASIRAGIRPARRWILLGGAVMAPILCMVGLNVVRFVTGSIVVEDDSPWVAMLVLPYGVTWLIVGLRMIVRGSPTIVDPPHFAIEPEVHPA